MGIQINGQTDTISATDGSFTISGASGNLTGNLTGNVTGNLTGDVTGNLTGDVTGNLTGTASTATAAANAYGLSGSPTLSGITSVSTTNLTVNGTAYPSAGPLSNRNKIINGDMRIDQRNAGASVTSAAAYTLDRWIMEEATDGAASVQQSTTTPSGFRNSLLWTTTTADASLGATQYGHVQQRIEGFNSADLEWGTANAQTVTLSFWVRSSLTGTFSGSLRNDGQNRCYPFTYTISSADTFEYKTVTIPGDTTGTWVTNNGVGIRVGFSLGTGSTFLGTSGSWTGSLALGATGETSVMGTLNATWYITGVQLEVGSVATPFEHRSYGQELSLCQRYYYKSSEIRYLLAARRSFDTGQAVGTLSLPTTMRDTPTVTDDGNFQDSAYAGTYTGDLTWQYAAPDFINFVTANSVGGGGILWAYGGTVFCNAEL